MECPTWIVKTTVMEVNNQDIARKPQSMGLQIKQKVKLEIAANQAMQQPLVEQLQIQIFLFQMEDGCALNAKTIILVEE